MSLRPSHLITLTMSVTWVARSILPPIRCERSPSPVVVAGLGGLERAPGLVGLALRQRLVEGGLRIFRGADIGLLRHLLARAGQLDRLYRHAVGLRRRLRVDPGAVLFADDAECLRRRRLPPGLDLLDRCQKAFAADLGGKVKPALAVLRFE